MKIEKISITKKLDIVKDYWNPKIAGRLNGQLVKLVKFKGEFVWHQHENEDEMFLVIRGSFKMELRDKTLNISEGEFVIIPKGTEHRPVAEAEVHVMLFEPASTLNTGSAKESNLTRHNLKII